MSKICIALTLSPYLPLTAFDNRSPFRIRRLPPPNFLCVRQPDTPLSHKLLSMVVLFLDINSCTNEAEHVRYLDEL